MVESLALLESSSTFSNVVKSRASEDEGSGMKMLGFLEGLVRRPSSGSSRIGRLGGGLDSDGLNSVMNCWLDDVTVVGFDLWRGGLDLEMGREKESFFMGLN